MLPQQDQKSPHSGFNIDSISTTIPKNVAIYHTLLVGAARRLDISQELLQNRRPFAAILLSEVPFRSRKRKEILRAAELWNMHVYSVRALLVSGYNRNLAFGLIDVL